MHLKRQKVPKSWPINRKGTKYVVRPNFDLKKGIPILVILRDILKIARTRKEVKGVIHNKYILLNQKAVKDEKNAALLFDKISILPAKKYYELILSGLGKFGLREITESETSKKIIKVVDKKILKGKKIQLNLSDGRNFISDIKCGINDSVVVDFKTRKILKTIPLREKAKVTVFAGKHTGETGIINSMNIEKKMAELDSNKGKVNVLIKQMIVTE